MSDQQNPFRGVGDPNEPRLKEAPRPGLAERFYINMEAATRQGTVGGALRDVSRPDNRKRFDSRYESFPEWDGLDEGAAALFGQIAGTIVDAERGTPHLENMLPIGLGEKALALGGKGLTSLRARLFAGAVDSAAVNAGTDAAIQGIEYGAGFREAFDPVQFASSVGLGAVAGGVMAPITHRPDGATRIADDLDSGVDSVDPVRQSALLEDNNHVAIEPDSSKMEIVDSQGAKVALDGMELQTDAKRAVMAPEGDMAPVALGDQLMPRSEQRAMAVKGDAPVLPENNGKWSLDDADIIDQGQFGPVIDVEAHNHDWGQIVNRFKEIESGEAPKAIYHPDIGDIDVVYGDYDPVKGKGMGLKKILEKHPEVIEKLPEIIEGATILTKTNNRIRLENGDNLAVIRLDYSGEAKTWLMTAFERGYSRRAKGSTERLDGRQTDTHSSSVSSTDTNIQLKSAKNKGTPPDTRAMQLDEPDSKGATDLDAVIQAMDAEVEPFIRARTRSMTGELRRDPNGIGREQALKNQERAFERLKDISEKLADLVGVAATRQGVLKWIGGKMRKALGTHNLRTGVIRLQIQDDFSVFAHEVGHHIEIELGKDFQKLMRLHAIELEPMAYVGADPDVKLEEGFAEFFRVYMTNPNWVAKEAPKFNKEFTRYLQQHKPDWLQGLADIQDAFHQWRNLPSDEAIASAVVTSKRKGLVGQALEDAKGFGIGHSIGDFLHDAYGLFMDHKHPIQRGVREVAKIYAKNTGQILDLKVADDPYKLARMLDGAQSAGHMDIMHGVHAYRSLEPGSASLRDALIEAMGGANVLSKWDENLLRDFGAYLWARRAVGEWDRFNQGLIPNEPDKYSRGDHARAIQIFEADHPQFINAAEKVYDWNRALWRKKLDAGLISQSQYRDGLAIRDYVPALRKFDYDGDPVGDGGGKKAKSAKADQVKRFVGSSRDVVNPLESLMADAYQTASAIAHNDMIKALDRLALRAGHGGGKIAERIPAKELRMIFKADPMEVIADVAKQNGYGPMEIGILRDGLEETFGDAKGRIFRPQIISENGHNIVFFRDGGQLRALRIADGKLGQQMMQSFGMMQKHEQNFWVDMLAMPATVMRTGITAAPEFIAANLIRDQVMAAIFYGKPFARVKETAKGGMDELFGRDAARRYNVVGGIMGGENVAALRDGAVNRDLQGLRKKGFVVHHLVNKDPKAIAKGLFALTEVSETSTRIGLFKTFFEEAKLRGLSEYEAALEASYRARDHIDFDRHGFAMTGLSRLVPLLNASLQGTDKTVRHMLMPLAKKAMGKVLTKEDEAALPMAIKSWARLSALMMAVLSIHVIMSQFDDYHELNDTTRASHWMIKSGNVWTAIPKPFELSIFLNMAEAVFDSVIMDDPLAYERWADGARQMLFPPNILESNPAIRSYFEGKSNKDFFTDRPIVPEHMRGLEPHLQYTARTSEFSKLIGEALGWSPAMTDKMIVNFTGGLGRSALALYDAAASDKPDQSLDDMAVLRRFIKSASKGSRSLGQFWELVAPSTGSFEGASKSYDAMLEAGDEAAAADYLAQMDEEKRVWLISRHGYSKAKKLHPLDRARRAVRAISKLRLDMADDTVTGADGDSVFTSQQRGVLTDILEEIAVIEARNALVLLEQPGWKQRGLMDLAGHYRELKAVNPKMHQILADRYATGKVIPWQTVQDIWPDYRKRLLEDGSRAFMKDLALLEKQGYELDGSKIKRKEKPDVPGLNDQNR